MFITVLLSLLTAGTKPFYSETVTWLKNHTDNEILICIALLEHGGKFPKNNNWGNLRKRNLTYHSYPSLEVGFEELRNLYVQKYSGKSLEDVAKLYSEQPSVWLTRFNHWKKILHNTY